MKNLLVRSISLLVAMMIAVPQGWATCGGGGGGGRGGIAPSAAAPEQV
jgi:hypothetical protein